MKGLKPALGIVGYISLFTVLLRLLTNLCLDLIQPGLRSYF